MGMCEILTSLKLNETFKNKNNRTLSRVFLKHDVSSGARYQVNGLSSKRRVLEKLCSRYDYFYS